MALSYRQKEVIRGMIGDKSLGDQICTLIDSSAAVPLRLRNAMASAIGDIRKANRICDKIASPAALSDGETVCLTQGLAADRMLALGIATEIGT